MADIETKEAKVDAGDEAKNAEEEAKAGGSCCPSGSLPALTEDTSRALNGTVEKLGDLTVYISRPTKAKNNGAGVIVLYDVHGFSGGRIKGVCDSFAEAGFLTVMPDVYGGTNITEQGGFGSETGNAFLTGVNWAALRPQLDACARYCEKNGAEVVGAAGFCWGAWAVFKYAATGEIAAGVSCHPSLRVGNLFHGETEAGVAAAVLCPQLLLPAANDPAEHYGEDGSVVAAVRAAHGAGLACETHTFADMQHGWVPRGDASDPAVARDVADALARAVAFFEAHLLAPTRFDAVHRHQDRMDAVVRARLDAKMAASKADVEALFAKAKEGGADAVSMDDCAAVAASFAQEPRSLYAAAQEGAKAAEKVGNPLPDYDANDPMWAAKAPYRPHFPPPAAEAAAEEGAAEAEAEGDEKKDG